ncbi:hypothetical protein JSY14_09785 [Brachybacterium sp. EF45031]|uniref:WXG100 family type VII secretion target n=1 Tax=Brachybacterium sillae TaxID=2810536 RepID=UPI00217D8B23|nr:hypothetical protein [Brachybacterium sillae]MCS6712293.1 hypothetical protein [Brachybacterium sillae]
MSTFLGADTAQLYAHADRCDHGSALLSQREQALAGHLTALEWFGEDADRFTEQLWQTARRLAQIAELILTLGRLLREHAAQQDEASAPQGAAPTPQRDSGGSGQGETDAGPGDGAAGGPAAAGNPGTRVGPFTLPFEVPRIPGQHQEGRAESSSGASPSAELPWYWEGVAGPMVIPELGQRTERLRSTLEDMLEKSGAWIPDPQEVWARPIGIPGSIPGPLDGALGGRVHQETTLEGEAPFGLRGGLDDHDNLTVALDARAEGSITTTTGIDLGPVHLEDELTLRGEAGAHDGHTWGPDGISEGGRAGAEVGIDRTLRGELRGVGSVELEGSGEATVYGESYHHASLTRDEEGNLNGLSFGAAGGAGATVDGSAQLTVQDANGWLHASGRAGASLGEGVGGSGYLTLSTDEVAVGLTGDVAQMVGLGADADLSIRPNRIYDDLMPGEGDLDDLLRGGIIRPVVDPFDAVRTGGVERATGAHDAQG